MAGFRISADDAGYEALEWLADAASHERPVSLEPNGICIHDLSQDEIESIQTFAQDKFGVELPLRIELE
jgi:hypothetical protein